MRVPTVVLLASVVILSISSAQEISADSIFCTSVGVKSPSDATKAKYNKMIDSLNSDKSLKAQQNRVTKFIKNNFKDLAQIEKKGDVQKFVRASNEQLAARARIVGYLNGLLAEMKQKLNEAQFNGIKNLLWETDKTRKQNVDGYYGEWKTAAINEISAVNKKEEIKTIIREWENKPPFKTFQKDQSKWRPTILTYRGCNL